MASEEKMGGSGSSHVVLYPSPGMGHLASMVEFAKVLVNYDLHVTILVVDPPSNASSSTAAFLDRVSALLPPAVSFHNLPPVAATNTSNYLHHESLHFEILRLSNQNLLSYLSSLPSPPAALFLDFFCYVALDITEKLNIPSYYFFTSPASCLAFFVHFPLIHHSSTSSFHELGSTPIHVPGLPPLPADHMIHCLLDRHDDAYIRFLEVAGSLLKVSGILINTFEWLESKAVDGMRSYEGMPPMYPVGPLIKSTSHDREDRCLAWLDQQPRASVVFLCFGSLGSFSVEQLKEIATGLEKSEQRFLWVVRSPPSEEEGGRFAAPAEADLDVLLPRGFVERTGGRGLVVRTWAPQRAVLGHEAVGGFVTHLGWNSVLEAIWEGVPMLGWPLYAEQRMNRVFVQASGVAMAMEGYEQGVVGAEEVERKVRKLMQVGEEEEGTVLRETTRVAREKAMAAMAEGGPSRRAMEEVVRLLKKSDATAPPKLNNAVIN